jgi:lipopolysaccharide export system permease protein
VLLVIALLALVVWPWANQQTQELKDRYGKRGDLERVAPGQFRESAGRNRVFFIDKDTPDAATATNVFISSIERNLQIITSARSGRLESVGETRYLMLSNGQRLERSLDEKTLKISEFDSYGTKVGSDVAASTDATPLRARPTLKLVMEPSPQNLGELAWRIGLLFAGINFVLLALTLSNVNPRVGRSANLLLALFAFVVYFNLLNLGQNWIGSGRVGMGAFMLALHGGILVLGGLWLLKRHNNWGLRLRRPATPPRTLVTRA